CGIPASSGNEPPRVRSECRTSAATKADEPAIGKAQFPRVSWGRLETDSAVDTPGLFSRDFGTGPLFLGGSVAPLDAALPKAGGLADAVAQVVELGAAHAPGALDLHLGDF